MLTLLERVLPKATHDPKLAGKIYQAIETELKLPDRATAIEQFCAKFLVPDLEPKSVQTAKSRLGSSFGDGDITLKPDRKEKMLRVEVASTDGSEFSGAIKVNPNASAATGEEQEITLRFAPFPVCLSGDKEFLWLLEKRENVAPEEAAIALIRRRKNSGRRRRDKS